MPIKEFVCNLTGNYPKRFEKRFTNYAEYVKAVADKSVTCPSCKRTTTVEPVIHSRTAPPKFEGSGFHATDYR